jgi:hypothetical protein
LLSRELITLCRQGGSRGDSQIPFASQCSYPMAWRAVVIYLSLISISAKISSNNPALYHNNSSFSIQVIQHQYCKISIFFDFLPVN